MKLQDFIEEKIGSLRKELEAKEAKSFFLKKRFKLVKENRRETKRFLFKKNGEPVFEISNTKPISLDWNFRWDEGKLTLIPDVNYPSIKVFNHSLFRSCDVLRLTVKAFGVSPLPLEIIPPEKVIPVSLPKKKQEGEGERLTILFRPEWEEQIKIIDEMIKGLEEEKRRIQEAIDV